MVRLRENTHGHLARHAVTTLLVRAALPAGTIKVHAAILAVGQRKEAAP
jgi:hypothetical protein